MFTSFVSIERKKSWMVKSTTPVVDLTILSAVTIPCISPIECVYAWPPSFHYIQLLISHLSSLFMTQNSRVFPCLLLCYYTHYFFTPSFTQLHSTTRGGGGRRILSPALLCSSFLSLSSRQWQPWNPPPFALSYSLLFPAKACLSICFARSLRFPWLDTPIRAITIAI